VAGRKLQQALGQKPLIAIITGEILPGTDGVIKMSKSLGNHIPLLSEPWDMFGKVMSIPDATMPIYHKLLLGWQADQLEAMENGLADGSLHPNEVKMNLARKIVNIFHSEEESQAAQQRWDEVFRSGKGGIPDDIPEAPLRDTERVTAILRRLNLVSSGKEAKRLIEQHGIKVDGQPVTDHGTEITTDMLPVILQVGKRKFVRLVGGS
jgi:tyrosyl-tRNA synthetase